MVNAPHQYKRLVSLFGAFLLKGLARESVDAAPFLRQPGVSASMPRTRHLRTREISPPVQMRSRAGRNPILRSSLSPGPDTPRGSVQDVLVRRLCPRERFRGRFRLESAQLAWHQHELFLECSPQHIGAWSFGAHHSGVDLLYFYLRGAYYGLNPPSRWRPCEPVGELGPFGKGSATCLNSNALKYRALSRSATGPRCAFTALVLRPWSARTAVENRT